MVSRAPGGKLEQALGAVAPRPESVIPALQALQAELGWLPPAALRAAAEHCRVPEATVYGVATFYAQFYLTRQGKHRIKVCRGTACHVRGSARIMAALQKKLGIAAGQTTADYRFTLERVACLGACALSPAVVIDERVHGQTTPEEILRAVARLK